MTDSVILSEIAEAKRKFMFNVFGSVVPTVILLGRKEMAALAEYSYMPASATPQAIRGDEKTVLGMGVIPVSMDSFCVAAYIYGGLDSVNKSSD